MTRYLVTGGAGFIGSNIVEILVKQGMEVRVADNFSTGRRENLAGVAGRIELLEGDLAELDFARYAVRDADYVLHQAAIPSVPRSMADPLATHRAGVTATLNLLVAAREAGVKRLVFASSSSVYGESVGTAKHEGLRPTPLSPYAVSKLAAEQYCLSFYTVYGFETVALRYFNVFGPRQDPASLYSAVIPKFITALLRGQSPTIYGDGEQTRDFTFVGNVVAANLCALTAPEAPGQYFNVAMGQATSLNQLMDILNELIGVDIQPTYAPPRKGDIKHSTAEVTKIREVLGFKPDISLLEGLGETVEWYRKQ
jgi:UDP-glucose 4-epimerase